MELEKTAEGMGFNIMGGKEQKCPIYISRIIPGGYADRHGGLRRGDQLVSVNGQVSEHTGWLNAVLCYICVLLQSLEDMDHEDAVKVLKDAQGIVSVNHTAILTCVNFIAGTLKMVVKYSPRGAYMCAWGGSVCILYVYVTRFNKTDRIVTFCILKNTKLKYSSHCGSFLLGSSYIKFTA